MTRYSVLLLLAALASTAAFTQLPPAKWGINPQTISKTQLFEEKKDLVLDTNFDDINIVRLLGLNRVKKLIRKGKRDAADDATESVQVTSDVKEGLKVIIAGAPASGKGTQCELIKEKYGVTHLSTGDMLRAAVAAGSEVGTLAKEYMDAGKLVPDEVIIGVVSSSLW